MNSADDDTEWICPACTLSNTPLSLACLACRTERHSNVGVEQTEQQQQQQEQPTSAVKKRPLPPAKTTPSSSATKPAKKKSKVDHSSKQSKREQETVHVGLRGGAAAFARDDGVAAALSSASENARLTLERMQMRWKNVFERNLADVPVASARREIGLVEALAGTLRVAEKQLHEIVGARVSRTLSPAARARAAFVFCFDTLRNNSAVATAADSLPVSLADLPLDLAKVITLGLASALDWGLFPEKPIARFEIQSGWGAACRCVVLPATDDQPRGTYLMVSSLGMIDEVNSDSGEVLRRFSLTPASPGPFVAVVDFAVLDPGHIAVLLRTDGFGSGGTTKLVVFNIEDARRQRDIVSLDPFKPFNATDTCQTVEIMSGHEPGGIAYDARAKELIAVMCDNKHNFAGFEVFGVLTDPAPGSPFTVVSMRSFGKCDSAEVDPFQQGIESATGGGFRRWFAGRRTEWALHIDLSMNRMLVLSRGWIVEFALPGYKLMPRGRPVFSGGKVDSIICVTPRSTSDLKLKTLPQASSLAIDAEGNVAVAFSTNDSGALRVYDAAFSQLAGTERTPRPARQVPFLFSVKSRAKDTDLKMYNLSGMAIDSRRGRLLLCHPTGLMLFGAYS